MTLKLGRWFVDIGRIPGSLWVVDIWLPGVHSVWNWRPHAPRGYRLLHAICWGRRIT